MSVEERYMLFEQRVKGTNKILEERYKLLFEEIKEKHKLKIKMIEDHYNRIVAMNKRSTHFILELYIRER